MARFDRAIPPGGEGEIILTLKTEDYQGTLRKTALVCSNDLKNPQIKLAIKARIKVPISFQPRGVMLEGFIDDEIKQVVTIKAHEEKPLTLELTELSLPEKVAYHLTAVEKGKVYQLALRNISKKRDKYSGFLTLKTNYPQKPEITIRFLGYVRGNLQCRPETINFGIIDSARLKNQKDKKFSHQRSLMVTLHNGDNLKIEKIEVNKEFFETRIKEIQAGKSYRIEIKFKPEKLPKGTLKEKMTIYTNLKNDPARVIPVRGQKM